MYMGESLANITHNVSSSSILRLYADINIDDIQDFRRISNHRSHYHTLVNNFLLKYYIIKEAPYFAPETII